VIGPRFQRGGGINGSERALAALADRSFLRLWTWPNLWMKQNSELADILVVFGDHVLIFSDKGAAYPATDDARLNWTRYYRRAIAESAHQINRAERWIERFPDKVFLDPRLETPLPVPLPPLERRVVHRICVAPAAADAARAEGLAGLRLAPAVVGDAERFATGRVEECRGWVHVFDQITLDNVLSELSTAPDLIAYLTAKEALVERGGLASAPSESDLLAGYLLNNRRFPADGAPLTVAAGLWTGLQEHPQYVERQRRDRISVFWDRLIERVYRGFVARDLELGNEIPMPDLEPILRLMAAEDRFNRRLLSMIIVERIEGQGGATLIPSSSPDLTYLTLIQPYDRNETERDYRYRRAQSLQLRILAAKAADPGLRKIIAIGLGQANARGGSEDLTFADTQAWSPEMIAHGQRVRDELGYFRDDRVVLNRQIEDEFPELD